MANSSKYDEIKEWYVSNFSEFESKLNGQSETFLHDLRKNAIGKLKELSFPTLKDEDWKYTNVSPILKENFKFPINTAKTEVSKETIDENSFGQLDTYKLVFVNGNFVEELSDIENLPNGVILDSLANMTKTKPDLVKKYIDKNSKMENAFNALNLAYATDGAFIYIPDGTVLDKHIQIIYLGGNANDSIISVPRNLIIAGKDSIAKVIANFGGYESNPYFTNTITEIFVAENANLDYVKIQNEKKNAFHIDKTDIDQKQGSNFNHYSISFGASLARTDINSKLDGENIECHYYGLYLGTDKQHVDHHTFVDHAKPNCLSNEVYKGIMDDDSRGVFNGQILVRQDAQKTNAYQSNKNVVLSDKARIDTKPQLEIFADDVKCSHGATVGQLDEEEYFYIRSRGIEEKMAQSMLIHAFASDVIESINIKEIHDPLNHKVFETLNRVEV